VRNPRCRGAELVALRERLLRIGDLRRASVRGLCLLDGVHRQQPGSVGETLEQSVPLRNAEEAVVDRILDPVRRDLELHESRVSVR
jgi:hypothetical protein